MTPLEIAYGYLLGYEGDVPAPSAGAPNAPRVAFEHAVLEALQRPPCVVAFSGGRDSSAVLAVATHVARREGLPEPIPVTRVWSDIRGTDESSWQEIVIRHLGIENWVRVELDDELDVIGPLAAPRLRRYGVLWPTLLHGDIPFFKFAAGGSLLDGESGDEVLGPDPHRIVPVTRLIRRNVRVRRSSLRAALVAVAPRPLRAWRSRRRAAKELPLDHLRPRVRARLLDDLAAHDSQAPLSWRQSVLRILVRRSTIRCRDNRRYFATEANVMLRSPFQDPDFLHALARTVGAFGFSSRTSAMTWLFGDLLPDTILGRRDKTYFNHAATHRHGRAFIDAWSGSGIDENLVDPDALRALWRDFDRNALGGALLQAAWLADQGLTGGLDTGSPDVVTRLL